MHTLFFPTEKRYKQLQGLVEDSLGQEKVPPDLPPDDKLIAAGGAVGAGGARGAVDGAIDAEALAALKGKCHACFETHA